MLKRIKELLAEGKSIDQIDVIVAKEFPDAKPEEVLEAQGAAQKAIEIEKARASAAAKSADDAAIDAKVQEKVDAALKKMKLDGLTDAKAVVEDNWQKDQAILFKNYIAQKSPDRVSLTQAEREFVKGAVERTANRWEAAQKDVSDGMVTGTDAAGGYLIQPQFDPEVDKLVYKNSKLLDAIKVRQGNDKTEINSMGTFNFSTRATQNSAFGETRPTLTQSELKYRESGAIVPIAFAALQGSYYNLISELMENAADAKIRFYEPLVCTGNVSIDGDAFNGIKFTSGITTLDARDAGGKLDSRDLTSMYMAAPAQSRDEATAAFIMDSRELMVLSEERAVAGAGTYLDSVELVNGTWIHKKTGKVIIPVNTLPRTCNGVTDHSTGQEVPVMFGPLNRFRIYQDGGMRVDQSTEIFFKEYQLALRFMFRFKQGIPTYSLSSFVSLQGVKSVNV